MVFNLFYLLYGKIVTLFPAPENYAPSMAFDQVFSFSGRIIFASYLTYFFSETVNALIIAKLKMQFQGKQMKLRFFFSNFIASGLDSFLFGFLAFFQQISMPDLYKLIFTMWFVKVLIEVLCLPFSTHLASKLKKLEKLDIYDFNTRRFHARSATVLENKTII